MGSDFQPSKTLLSKTFIGLLIAQFLAAFNDQAIHASAMFFAINQNALNEAQAISLMPILFYAPWALFCSIAGYYADKFSKRTSLVFWKIAEVGITLIALLGFWLGVQNIAAGPWIVLSTVFLMGMHSAFFVPAKYGVMPEILKSHLLSRGNGLLESLSFLAVILGTVSGGVLSYQFRGQEYMIGVVLLGLAIIGALASLMITPMPAANPTRKFPAFVYLPVWDNLKGLLLSRPLAVAVIGLAFFTFIVAFTRATIYMHGESQIPRWTELKTSAIVGMVALGICFGSPLVGFLSGGKVELGLVPVGILGMVTSIVALAFNLTNIPILITLIITTGFFTGFYVVPLFTLIQQRAPKTSKGDAIATSNLINVTGAILASILFYVIVKFAHSTGICPPIQFSVEAQGKLKNLKLEHGRPVEYTLETGSGIAALHKVTQSQTLLLDPLPKKIMEGDEVVVSRYQRGGIEHRRISHPDQATEVIFDNHQLPEYLFLGAALFTLSTLVILRVRMPDLFFRSVLWTYYFPRCSLRAHNLNSMPGKGPALLIHEGHSIIESFYILAVTDRTARTLFVENHQPEPVPTYLGFLARFHNLGWLKQADISKADLDIVNERVRENLAHGHVVSVSADGPWIQQALESARANHAPVVPVRVTRPNPTLAGNGNVVYVNFGEALPDNTDVSFIRTRCGSLQDPVSSGENQEA